MKTIFRERALFPLVFVALVCVAGCPMTFEGSLPGDLDASMRHILDNPGEFQQDAMPFADTGDVRDDLGDLAGCWGAFVEAVAGQGPLGQMDSYSLLRFEPPGGLTTWDVQDIGGVAATSYDGSGHYTVIGENRLRFTIKRRRYYNPLSRSYGVFDDQQEVSEWLATLDGNRLYLRMLDEPGAPAPGPNEPNYTIVYYRFDCAK